MSVTIAYAPEVGAPGAIPVGRLDDWLAGMPIDALLREVIARASALDPEGEPSLVVTVDGVRCYDGVSGRRGKRLSTLIVDVNRDSGWH